MIATGTIRSRDPTWPCPRPAARGSSTRRRGVVFRGAGAIPRGPRVPVTSRGAGAIFILPNGSWVLVSGRILGRVRYHFFTHAEEPPPSQYEPDALLAVWVGPGIAKASRGAQATPADGEADSDVGLEGGALVIGSSARGDVVLSATFVDEEHAGKTVQWIRAMAELMPAIQSRLADQCPAWQGMGVEVSSEGRTLSGRLSNLAPVVRAYRSGACRYSHLGGASSVSVPKVGGARE